MSESQSDRPHSHLDPDRVAADVAALWELIAAGVVVDGQAQVTDSIWVIYGHTSYDGEVLVGEYPDPVEASEVLDATRLRGPDGDWAVP
jgi:hypothetical protein